MHLGSRAQFRGSTATTPTNLERRSVTVVLPVVSRLANPSSAEQEDSPVMSSVGERMGSLGKLSGNGQGSALWHPRLLAGCASALLQVLCLDPSHTSRLVSHFLPDRVITQVSSAKGPDHTEHSVSFPVQYELLLLWRLSGRMLQCHLVSVSSNQSGKFPIETHKFLGLTSSPGYSVRDSLGAAGSFLSRLISFLCIAH